MIVFITGASGFIGSRLVEHLLARGDSQIYALVRNPAKLSWLENNPALRLVSGDLQTLPDLPKNIEVVFHLAGLTKATNHSDYYTVNQTGTARLVEHMIQNRLSPKFIYLSSLAAGRPAANGQPVREDEPPEPASPYGQSKLLAEQEVLKYKDILPTTIIRAAAIYGPRDRDFLQFFELIDHGWMFTFSQKITMSLCYVDDLIMALELCAEKSRGEGEIYNVADPVPRTWEDIGEEAARILNKKVRKVKVPLWLARTAAGMSELGSKLSGKPKPLNLSKYRDMEKLSWVADPSRIKEELGFETTWPFSQALEATINWYKANGWL
ncbi:MAG TPA: NAD-dependent epimerase/dehydratase family protein [Candidatus Saccharicenans sp.]|jgi:nucleoside-diphosphate-sugar epimerase|nr:NAD-dependent epimerase/dehydratase family protein [Candidatus Saccharicenans sp.]HRD02611.1 NAD-dependent epimerase/dehydratase family protein [Candidatus Saccharicenans sp.]